MKMAKRFVLFSLIASVCFLLGAVVNAFADYLPASFNLVVGTSRITGSGYATPYATVVIQLDDLDPGKAIVTVTTKNGYLLGGQKLLSLNLSEGATASGFSAPFIKAAKPTKKSIKEGGTTVDKFGKYDLILNNTAWWKKYTTLQFTLTKQSGVWESAEDVLDTSKELTYNGAAHIYYTDAASRRCHKVFDGYAAGKLNPSGNPDVPVPAALLLMGPGIAAIFILRKKIKK